MPLILIPSPGHYLSDFKITTKDDDMEKKKMDKKAQEIAKWIWKKAGLDIDDESWVSRCC